MNGSVQTVLSLLYDGHAECEYRLSTNRIDRVGKKKRETYSDEVPLRKEGGGEAHEMR